MGELSERRWAVISERGCEAMRLDYAGAVEYVRGLKAEKVRGLCIVTETAAVHLRPAKPAEADAAPAADSGRTRRTTKK